MNILLVGYGKMGKMIEELAAEQGSRVVRALDVEDIATLQEMGKVADVVMDFSSPAALPQICEYVGRTGTPLVCGTTGHNDVQTDMLKQAATKAPVLYSANYSLGIAVMRRALAQVSAALLPGFDAELTETHHNQKADAPSGTAKMLLEVIDPHNEYRRVYGREGMCGRRGAKEIGVHSLRGGSEAGEHAVTFFGTDEVLELRHRAASRRIFAAGALKAAERLVSKAKGYYTFDDIMFE